jgi:hypothetical protein
MLLHAVSQHRWWILVVFRCAPRDIRKREFIWLQSSESQKPGELSVSPIREISLLVFKNVLKCAIVGSIAVDEVPHPCIGAVMSPFAAARIDRKENDAGTGAPVLASNQSGLRPVDQSAREERPSEAVVAVNRALYD